MPDRGSVRGTWGRYAPSFAAEGSAAEDRDSLRTLVARCALPAGARVLDVATGAGYTAFAFARAGAKPIGLDPTHEMLLAARDGWAARELPGPFLGVEAWAEALPFRDGSLDAVVAHRAPHQFRDARAWLAECHRVLRAGGRFGMADQSPPDGWAEWHDTLERLRDPTHEHALPPGRWRQLVDEAGFEDVEHTVVHQPHDVEDWLDRVDCPVERRAGVIAMLEDAPPEVHDVYGIEWRDGRLVMRTPQVVLTAIKP